MEIAIAPRLASFAAAVDDAVHPVLYQLLALLVPVNIYVIGDWMGAGVQCPLFRYQETYLGTNTLSIFTDAGYLLRSTLVGKTALATGIWILGALLLLAALGSALFRGRERGRRIRGMLLASGTLLFLVSTIIQYGPAFQGPAGLAIPVGIPILLLLGLILLVPVGEIPTVERAPHRLAALLVLLVLLFLLCFFVYNTTTYIRMSGDVTPAEILPVAILRYGEINFDRFAPDITNPENMYAFVPIGGHYYSIFPIVTPVLMIPLYLVPWTLVSLWQVPVDIALISALARFASAVVAALSVVLVFLSARTLFSGKAALLTTVAYAFGTATWAISSQAPWQQGMIELLLAAILFLLIQGEAEAGTPRLVPLGILSGLLVMARPPDALLILPVILYVLWYHRQKLPVFLTAGLLAALPFLLYNLAIFGSPLGGYEKTAAFMGLSPLIPIRFLGYLVAPNIGFFVFSPVLILGLAGYFRTGGIANPRVQKVLVVYGPVLLFTLLVYSFYPGWAGAAYGPRYLTGLLPVYILYLGLLLEDILRSPREGIGKAVLPAFAILLAISILVQAIGVFCYPYIRDVSMDEKRVWDAGDLLILRSYHDGAERVRGIRVNTMPPLPPLIAISLRPGTGTTGPGDPSPPGANFTSPGG